MLYQAFHNIPFFRLRLFAGAAQLNGVQRIPLLFLLAAVCGAGLINIRVVENPMDKVAHHKHHDTRNNCGGTLANLLTCFLRHLPPHSAFLCETTANYAFYVFTLGVGSCETGVKTVAVTTSEILVASEINICEPLVSQRMLCRLGSAA